jgi:hypothetical protein
MTYLPLHSGQCDPNKIKQLSFQIGYKKYYNKFKLVMVVPDYQVFLNPEKNSGCSGRILTVGKLQVKNTWDFADLSYFIEAFSVYLTKSTWQGVCCMTSAVTFFLKKEPNPLGPGAGMTITSTPRSLALSTIT